MQFLTGAVIEPARAVAGSALRALYPPYCMTCDTLIDEHGALCPECWRQTPFIFGLCCDLCGVPLPGQDSPGAAAIICDDCITIARPWEQGRAAMLYGDKARQILLGLKYRDRLDHVPPAAKWLSRAAQPLLLPDMLITPIPLHWLRLLKRRYNQAALLSHALARETGLAHCPDLLIRIRNTGTQDGRGREGRFANLQGAIRPHPRRAHLIRNRHILLVDDVMTAGATFSAATEACLAHGAASVRVIALARVASRG
ncbi:MAG: ComF family protein [Rhodobacteraceae bacterium]|nr:ComF family protein [Paracoccaceae bacterium]